MGGLGEVRMQLWTLSVVKKREIDGYLATVDRSSGCSWARTKSTGTWLSLSHPALGPLSLFLRVDLPQAEILTY